MNCPNCAAPMAAMSLEAHLSAPVEIDLCSGCQAFWFDRYESLKLSPGSVLQLMKLIGEHAGGVPSVVSAMLLCPRCSAHLLPINDIQRATRFSYWRCDGHGKFMRFLDFLKEKNFIRPMAAEQIQELRQNVKTVNCSSCGAPIDLAASSACTHCGAAISMLDMNQAQQTLAQLQKAAEPRRIDPALPLELERVRREVERSYGPMHSDAGSDLIQDVLNAVGRWMGNGSI